MLFISQFSGHQQNAKLKGSLSLSLSLSLSVLTAIFPGEPWLFGFIGTKDDGSGGTTGAIRHAKLQSNRHHQQTQNSTFYRPDALPVAQPTVSKY